VRLLTLLVVPLADPFGEDHRTLTDARREPPRFRP
jgi:hypothetical protein